MEVEGSAGGLAAMAEIVQDQNALADCESFEVEIVAYMLDTSTDMETHQQACLNRAVDLGKKQGGFSKKCLQARKHEFLWSSNCTPSRLAAPRVSSP